MSLVAVHDSLPCVVTERTQMFSNFRFRSRLKSCHTNMDLPSLFTNTACNCHISSHLHITVAICLWFTSQMDNSFVASLLLYYFEDVDLAALFIGLLVSFCDLVSSPTFGFFLPAIQLRNSASKQVISAYSIYQYPIMHALFISLFLYQLLSRRSPIHY